jgi:hypothetical protein
VPKKSFAQNVDQPLSWLRQHLAAERHILSAMPRLK